MADPLFPLLDAGHEDALHLSRLLTVEERPFQRITKRLLAKDALIARLPTQLATPPPDQTEVDESGDAAESRQRDLEAEIQRYRDDILLDFAALESTLIRIQFLKRANERERERYATEKLQITATTEAVRANTAELRVELVEAQQTLALKKEYDEAAEKIFKDKALKPRAVLQGEIERLKAEIEDLEQESKDFDGLWQERSDRFDRVVAEGKALSSYISGEHDDGDLDEDGEDQLNHESVGAGESSAIGTPRAEAGGATPIHGDMEGDESRAAQHELAQRALRSSTRATSGRSTSSSRAHTPTLEADVKDTHLDGVNGTYTSEGGENMDTS